MSNFILVRKKGTEIKHLSAPYNRAKSRKQKRQIPTREDIEKATIEYLKKGGKITVITQEDVENDIEQKIRDTPVSINWSRDLSAVSVIPKGDFSNLF